MKKTELPYTWRQLKLEDVIFDIQPGFAQAPSDSGSVAQIRTLNISPDGRLDLNGVKYVDPSIKEIGKYSLCYGDVIFNNTNSEEWVGKTAFYDSKESLVFSNHITRLRVDHEVILPEYLAKYLHFLWFTGYSKHKAKRWVSQAGVEQSELLMFPVSTPPLEEQKYIVEILQQADELRRLRQDSLAKAEKLASALFLEMFGDPESNPKKLLVTTLGDKKISDKITDGTHQSPQWVDDGVPFLFVRNIVNRKIRWDVQRFISEESWLELTKSTPVNAGDILYTTVGSIGNAALVGNDVRFCFQRHIAHIKPNLKNNNPFFLWAMLNSEGVTLQAERVAVGVAQKTINLRDLRKLKVFAVDKEEQEKFVKLLNEVVKYEHEIDIFFTKLELLLNDLSAKAFTGKLTDAWREQHSELSPVNIGAKKVTPVSGHVTLAVTAETTLSVFLESRKWLWGQLSQFQKTVLHQVYRSQGYLTEEGLGDLIDELPEDINYDQEQKIRKTLEQLVALGLIVKVSLQDKESGFVTAYRALRQGDDSKGRDSNMLEVW